MKLKRMWLPLVPTMVIMAGIKVYQQYIEFSGEYFPGKENVIASYAAVGVVFLSFLVLLIMSLLDRRTAPVYSYNRNIPAGGVCLFAASVAVVDLGCYMPDVLLRGAISPLIIANIVFSALAAFGMYLLCWAHISTDKPPKSVSLLMLGVPAWCLVKLVTFLFRNSTVSVVLTDTLQLFIYMFLALFMFAAISMISILKNGNPIKRLMLFGVPLISVVFTLDVSVAFNIIYNGYQTGYYLEIISAVELTLFAFYAFLIMKEISLNAINKEDVKIIETEEELEEIVNMIKEEKIKAYEEKRDIEREKGNFYITDKNEYDANTYDKGDKTYGYYGRRRNSYGSYGSINTSYTQRKTYFPDGTYVADKAYIDENGETVFISDENELSNVDNFGVNHSTSEKTMSHIDRLILEITSGHNDLDLNDME